MDKNEYFKGEIDEYNRLLAISNKIVDEYYIMKPDREAIIKSDIKELHTGVNNLVERIDKKIVNGYSNLSADDSLDEYLSFVKHLLVDTRRLINKQLIRDIIVEFYGDKSDKFII